MWWAAVVLLVCGGCGPLLAVQPPNFSTTDVVCRAKVNEMITAINNHEQRLEALETRQEVYCDAND